MDRNVPPQFENGQLRYIATIKGEGGDLDKLKTVLKYRVTSSPTGEQINLLVEDFYMLV